MPARPTVSEPGRDEIMTAAKKMFGRNGFDATTIADVAKEAGLSFDVVYQYFDSKDALFQALIGAQEHALRTHVAVALAASGATFGSLIGQIAHRRLSTDDGITAAEAADFVVSFVMKGLRPDHAIVESRNHNGRSARSAWRIDRGGMFVHHRRGKHLVR